MAISLDTAKLVKDPWKVRVQQREGHPKDRTRILHRKLHGKMVRV